jgi:chaperonin cofactor prefoldin
VGRIHSTIKDGDVINGLQNIIDQVEYYEDQIKELEESEEKLMAQVEELTDQNNELEEKIKELEEALAEAYLTGDGDEQRCEAEIQCGCGSNVSDPADY